MKPLTSTICAVLALTAGAHAQLLTETFTYPDGSLVGAPGSPWQNNTGTLGQQNIVSGELFLNDTESEDTFAPFSSTVVSGSISATLNLRGDPADLPSSAAGDFFVHFRSSANGFVGRIFSIAPSVGDPANSYRLGLSTTAGTPSVAFASTFQTGTNYQLTLSYNFGTDLASLSVSGVGVDHGPGHGCL